MATSTEKHIRSSTEYNKKNTKTVTVRFFPYDMELYEYMQSVDNKSGYIKRLIRKDMEENAS